jgi:hypothetical protein
VENLSSHIVTCMDDIVGTTSSGSDLRSSPSSSPTSSMLLSSSSSSRQWSSSSFSLLSQDSIKVNNTNDGSSKGHHLQPSSSSSSSSFGESSYIAPSAASVITKHPEAMIGLIEKGNQVRTIAATNMNQQSSRSHSIFIVEVRCATQIKSEDKVCVCSNQ